MHMRIVDLHDDQVQQQIPSGLRMHALPAISSRPRTDCTHAEKKI